MKNTQIQKAVLLVAGKGTRLLPMTSYVPKGLVPVLDKPMIHWMLEEFRLIGIKHIIIVTSPNQTHFKEYVKHLMQLPEWKSSRMRFDFTIQQRSLGAGDALLSAKPLLNKEPFLVYYCDNAVFTKPSLGEHFLKLYKQFQTPIVPIEKVPRSIITQYATVNRKRVAKNRYLLIDIIEKPKPHEIMSLYSAMPFFALTNEIFPYIQKAKRFFKAKKEIAIADVLTLYCRDKNLVHGWVFDGVVFNTGLKDGLFQANLYTALKNPFYRKEFKKFLSNIDKKTKKKKQGH